VSKTGKVRGNSQRGSIKSGSPRGGHVSLRRDKVTTIKQAIKAARRAERERTS
jgi:hypothetical protein